MSTAADDALRAAPSAAWSADFRALFEAAPTPLLVLERQELRIVAANDAYLRATMTERGQIVGRPFFDVFPDDPDDGHATGAAQLRASFDRVLESGRLDAMAVQRHPIRRGAGAGGGFVERWWSFLNMPVPGDAGEATYVIHRAEDVTEIVRLRQANASHDQLARDQQSVIERLREATREAARARAELHSELECLRRLHAFAGSLARAPDMTSMCAVIAEEMKAVLGADIGEVRLVHEPGDELRLVERRGDVSERMLANVPCPVCDSARERGERVVVEDAQAPGVDGAVREAALQGGWRAACAMPMPGVSGGALGVLATRFRQPRHWKARNLRMLDLFAGIAGEAIAGRMGEQALRAEQARQAFIVALDDLLRPLHDARQIQLAASRMLLEHLRADVVVYSEGAGNETVTPTAVSRAPGRSPIEGPHRLDDFGPMVAEEILGGRAAARDDVAADAGLTPSHKAKFAAVGIGAWANAPLVKEGHLAAMLTAVFETPHEWTRDELRLLEHVAERTWSAAERARAETALAQSEARFRLLFDSIDQGFATIEMLYDADGEPADYRFLQTNQAFAVQTGVTDPVGRTARELVPDLEPFWVETYGRIARTGKPERFEHVAASIGRWFDVYAFRIGEPALRQLAILFADIGERKRAEEALRNSEARLRAALMAGNMATWSWDPTKDHLTASDTLSEVFGLHAGQSIERTADGTQLIHPEDRERHLALVTDATRTGGSWHSEFRIVRPRDGRVAWLEERALAMRDPATGELRMDGLVWDITQRKEAEAALVEADKAKNRFLAVVSHELKNPLNLIQLNAELLSRLPEARTQPQISRGADALRKAVNGLAALVDDLLDLSRLNTGKLTFRPSVVDLGQLIPSIVAAVKPQARARGIAIAADIEADVWVNADVTRLEQVIWNLLANAMKFTPAGGRIEVRLEVVHAQAVLEVTDTGQGIEPEALARIFDLFVQEDRESARTKGGLGIGLALVKQIAELHGGRVEARSPGTGHGSTFILRLPLAPATMPKAQDPTEPQAPRLLLVEDEADSAEALRQLLGLEGYAVEIANDGQEGLDRATGEGRPYDVVVSDIAMPNLDGVRFIRALREHPKTAHIAAVALTGYARESETGAMVEAGFDDVVAKPVRLDALLHGIQRALARRGAASVRGDAPNDRGARSGT